MKAAVALPFKKLVAAFQFRAILVLILNVLYTLGPRDRGRGCRRGRVAEGAIAVGHCSTHSRVTTLAVDAVAG